MKLNSAIENYIHSWAEAASGITFIWDKQRYPTDRPSLPYGTLSILHAGDMETEIGLEYITTDTYNRIFSQPITITINIFTNSNYYDYANKMKKNIKKDDVKLGFHQNGLVFRYFSDTRDISKLLDTDFEQRITFDIDFAYISQEQETIKEIERVTGTIGNLIIDTNDA